MIAQPPRLVKLNRQEILDSLTDRQQATYYFIVSYKLTHDGCAPSIRDIMDYLCIGSTSSMSYTLRVLENAGLVRLHGGRPNHIEVVGGSWAAPVAERRAE